MTYLTEHNDSHPTLHQVLHQGCGIGHCAASIARLPNKVVLTSRRSSVLSDCLDFLYFDYISTIGRTHWKRRPRFQTAASCVEQAWKLLHCKTRRELHGLHITSAQQYCIHDRLLTSNCFTDATEPPDHLCDMATRNASLPAAFGWMQIHLPIRSE